MENTGQRRLGAFALGCALAATGCGSGGAGGPGGGTGPGALALNGTLQVTAHAPADLATGVATGTRVVVQCDGVVVADSLRHPESGLRTAAGVEVPGSWSLESGGQTIVFTPAGPLAEATDYAFRLSPLTCDVGGRILDRDTRFTFRTIDTIAPRFLSASPAINQSGADREAPLTVTFDEPVAPSSVSSTTVALVDEFAVPVPFDVAVEGATVTVTPHANLAGDRNYELSLAGGTASSVLDRAGNPLAATRRIPFRTAVDGTAPSVSALWPAAVGGVSPLAHPRIAFDEAVDVASVEPSSVRLVDEFGGVVGFTPVASRDARTLRLVPDSPLVTGRTYTLDLVAGPAGVTDLSGNTVAAASSVTFAVGTDTTPPTVTGRAPAASSTRVSINAQPSVTFSEALDPATAVGANVALVGNEAVACTVSLDAGNTVLRIVPDAGHSSLEPGIVHQLIQASDAFAARFG